jgi:RHS repeat-associated protein
MTDGLLHTTTNIYDPLNRAVTNLFPDGTTTITVYDAGGRKIESLDQASQPTYFGYDGLGRLTSVTNALSKVTRYAYDEAGNQTNLVDALLRTNSYQYDALGRRTMHTLPGSQSESFGYDQVGNQVLSTNFNGVVITNQYDLMNRLTNCASAGGPLAAFTYTLDGQRQTMIDPSGAYSYTYDVRDRVTNYVTPQGTLRYQYDANGNLTNLSSSTSGGTQVGYQFDALNRLTNVIDGSLGTALANTAYGYDPVGNLQRMQFPNGMSNTYQYDSLNRLTNLVWKTNNISFASFAYQLGPTGNRTNLQETMLGGVNRTNRWSYDPVYKLNLETIVSSTNSSLKSLGYTYDDVGNRLTRSATNFTDIATLTNQSFLYNTNDWLASDGYDNNGNTTNSAGTNYFYDVENRLTNVTCGSFSVTVVYNGDGERVAKTVSSGGTATTTLFLVDTHNLTGYAQVLEELQPSGGATNLMRAYTYGLSLVSQRLLGSSTNFCGMDGHGSVRFLASTNGTVTDTFTYDAFGTLVNTSGTTPNNYLYCGEQLDWDVGLYFLRARYMNPNIGRFWTMDTDESDQSGANTDSPPIPSMGETRASDSGEDLENPLTLHKYLYCGNNPVNNSDPTGHDFEVLAVIDIMTVGMDTLGGPPITPTQATSSFRVYVRADDDHAWIYVENLITGQKHTYGRWKIGYGLPKANSSGVLVDRELKRSFRASRGIDVKSFTPTINAGYTIYNNNCATYAQSEWNRVSGESLKKSGPFVSGTYDLPGVLKDSILEKNGGKKEVLIQKGVNK